MYPERRGQRTGTLDPGIVLLDGLGLLLFFVPGVIAFAVDFATGAIYLPEGGGPSISGTSTAAAEMPAGRFPAASLSFG